MRNKTPNKVDQVDKLYLNRVTCGYTPNPRVEHEQKKSGTRLVVLFHLQTEQKRG